MVSFFVIFIRLNYASKMQYLGWEKKISTLTSTIFRGKRPLEIVIYFINEILILLYLFMILYQIWIQREFHFIILDHIIYDLLHDILCIFHASKYAEVHVSGPKIYGYNARILFFFFLWWPNLHFGSQCYQCRTFCYLWFVTKITLQKSFATFWCILVFKWPKPIFWPLHIPSFQCTSR